MQDLPIDRNFLPGGLARFYQHYYNKLFYELISYKVLSQEEIRLVLYAPLYESDTQFFTRPIGEFFEKVSMDGKMVARFTKVNYEDLPFGVYPFVSENKIIA